jgi:hypothetical protein
MSRNTVFLEDTFGAGWRHEISEDMRMPPPILDVVRGLTPGRYLQLWQLFPDEPNTDVLLCLSQGFDIARTSEMVGLSKRQVKNAIAGFLDMARAAFGQPSFLPPATVTEARIPMKRTRSRRGRPPKRGKALPAITSMQVPLPF